MKGKRGITIAELMIAATLLGVLTTAAFAIFRLGSSAWLKAGAQNELLQDLQLGSNALAREAESSVYTSLSLAADASAVAFLSSIYNSNPDADTSGNPIWHSFIVYYHDQTAKELKRVEVPYSPASTSPDTLGNHTGSPIESHLSGGRVIARNIYECSFSIYGSNVLEMELHGQRKRLRDTELENRHLQTSVLLRN